MMRSWTLNTMKLNETKAYNNIHRISPSISTSEYGSSDFIFIETWNMVSKLISKAFLCSTILLKSITLVSIIIKVSSRDLFHSSFFWSSQRYSFRIIISLFQFGWIFLLCSTQTRTHTHTMFKLFISSLPFIFLCLFSAVRKIATDFWDSVNSKWFFIVFVCDFMA